MVFGVLMMFGFKMKMVRLLMMVMRMKVVRKVKVLLKIMVAMRTMVVLKFLVVMIVEIKHRFRETDSGVLQVIEHLNKFVLRARTSSGTKEFRNNSFNVPPVLVFS